jgi:hypothetical protein
MYSHVFLTSALVGGAELQSRHSRKPVISHSVCTNDYMTLSLHMSQINVVNVIELCAPCFVILPSFYSLFSFVFRVVEFYVFLFWW